MAIFDQKLVKTGCKQGDCGKNSSFFEKNLRFFLRKTRLTDSQWPKTCPKCKNSEKISGKFFHLRALKELDFGSGLCRFFGICWLAITKNRPFLAENRFFKMRGSRIFDQNSSDSSQAVQRPQLCNKTYVPVGGFVKGIRTYFS